VRRDDDIIGTFGLFSHSQALFQHPVRGFEGKIKAKGKSKKAKSFAESRFAKAKGKKLREGSGHF